MKSLTVLLACAALALAPAAFAQQAPRPLPPKDTKSGLLAKPEIKQDARAENCRSQAAARNLRGEERENFLTKCLGG